MQYQTRDLSQLLLAPLNAVFQDVQKQLHMELDVGRIDQNDEKAAQPTQFASGEPTPAVTPSSPSAKPSENRLQAQENLSSGAAAPMPKTANHSASISSESSRTLASPQTATESKADASSSAQPLPLSPVENGNAEAETAGGLNLEPTTAHGDKTAASPSSSNALPFASAHKNSAVAFENTDHRQAQADSLRTNTQTAELSSAKPAPAPAVPLTSAENPSTETLTHETQNSSTRYEPAPASLRPALENTNTSAFGNTAHGQAPTDNPRINTQTADLSSAIPLPASLAAANPAPAPAVPLTSAENPNAETLTHETQQVGSRDEHAAASLKPAPENTGAKAPGSTPPSAVQTQSFSTPLGQTPPPEAANFPAGMGKTAAILIPLHSETGQSAGVAPSNQSPMASVSSATANRFEAALDPALQQAYQLTQQQLQGASETNTEAGAQNLVRNTFNVSVAMNSNNSSEPVDLGSFEQALTDVLRMAARRQGLEI